MYQQTIEEQLDLLVNEEGINILQVFLPNGSEKFFVVWEFDHPGKSVSQSVNYFTVISGIEITGFILKVKNTINKSSYIADFRRLIESKLSAVNLKFNENIPYIFYEPATNKIKL